MKSVTDYTQEHFTKQKMADERVADMLARETDHSLKLAGISAFSAGREVITEDDLSFGIFWAGASSNAMLKLSADIGLTNDESKLLAFIKSTALQKGIIRKSDISRKFGGTQRRWDDAIIQLLNKDMIERFGEGYVPMGSMSLVSSYDLNSENPNYSDKLSQI